jgi:hypothetical protein
MADAQTCELKVTQALLNFEYWNDLWQYIFRKWVAFVKVIVCRM